MKRFPVLFLLLSACLPQTEFISDGHYVLQYTYTRNLWVSNISHVTRCLKSEVRNGGCEVVDTRQTERLDTAMPGPAVQMASAAIHGMFFLGGMALLGTQIKSGLTGQQTASPVFASTLNTTGPIPGLRFVGR